MTAESIPYALGTDNLILSLFMASLLSMAYLFQRDGSSIVERVKNIFYYTSSATPYNTRTAISSCGNVILYCNTILYGSIIATGYVLRYNKSDEEGGYRFILSFALLFTLTQLFKLIIYNIVNRVLFNEKQAREWNSIFLFTNQIVGFLILPIAALLILYPQIHSLIFWPSIAIASIIYLYILSIRCFNIIFNKSFYFLDIFLYLCAIEFVPFVILWHVIYRTNLFLMINF